MPRLFIDNVKDSVKRLSNGLCPRPTGHLFGGWIQQGDIAGRIAHDHRVSDTLQGGVQRITLHQGFIELFPKRLRNLPEEKRPVPDKNERDQGPATNSEHGKHAEERVNRLLICGASFVFFCCEILQFDAQSVHGALLVFQQALHGVIWKVCFEKRLVYGIKVMKAGND